MKAYAGLGCKEISPSAEKIIKQVAEQMDKSGYTLRTGGNIGAQKAFERGAKSAEVLTPWEKDYKIHDKAFDIASGCAPNWGEMTNSEKKILASQVHILLGKTLDKPVQFVLIWENMDNSKSIRYIRRLAAMYNIRVYNLANYGVMEIMQALGGGV